MIGDRIKTAIAGLARVGLSQVDYLGFYPCRVDSQNADGTLELTPEASHVAKQSKVPIRLGLPGAAVKVQAGSRVMLGWENADSTTPFASLWGGPNTTVELKLDATNIILNSGSTPVAKEGSVTTGHTHSFSLSSPSGAVTGTISNATDTIASGAGSPHVKVP